MVKILLILLSSGVMKKQLIFENEMKKNNVKEKYRMNRQKKRNGK